MARPRTTRRGPAASAARGEHSLTLAGVTYRLRPSFDAITAIEDAVGPSLIDVARRCSAMTLSLSDLGLVLAELIRAGAEKGDVFTAQVDGERIAQLIFEEGQSTAYALATVALSDAITGGRTASGEAKAVTTT